VDYQEDEMFTIEGTIESLRIAPGVVNLIEDIQKGVSFAGAIAGIAGEPGVLANCASVAMYDGEDVEHIALLINGVLAIGTFEWLRDLNVGDDVKLVVSDIYGGPLFIHAILRKNDQLLWTPTSITHTRRGWMLHGLKLGGLILSMTWTMFGLLFIFDKESRPNAHVLSWFIFGTIALITFVTFMSASGVMHLGQQAENIFRALGVPRYERFRLKPYSVCTLHLRDDPAALKKRYIFHLSQALAAHTKRFKLS
jgi:hypothetical protein